MAKNYTNDYINCVEQYMENNTQLLTIQEKYEIILEHVEDNTLKAYDCIDSYENFIGIIQAAKCKYHVSTY